jgi:hypothetical protein
MVGVGWSKLYLRSGVLGIVLLFLQTFSRSEPLEEA